MFGKTNKVPVLIAPNPSGEQLDPEETPACGGEVAAKVVIRS